MAGICFAMDAEPVLAHMYHSIKCSCRGVLCGKTLESEQAVGCCYLSFMGILPFVLAAAISIRCGSYAD